MSPATTCMGQPARMVCKLAQCRGIEFSCWHRLYMCDTSSVHQSLLVQASRIYDRVDSKILHRPKCPLTFPSWMLLSIFFREWQERGVVGEADCLLGDETIPKEVYHESPTVPIVAARFNLLCAKRPQCQGLVDSLSLLLPEQGQQLDLCVVQNGIQDLSFGLMGTALAGGLLCLQFQQTLLLHVTVPSFCCLGGRHECLWNC